MSLTFWPNGSRTQRPKVTNAFGVVHPRYSLKPWPGGGMRRWHTGDDTAGYAFNHAPADGVVVFAGYAGSYGNTVIVEHAGGVRSRTSHGAPGGILVRVREGVSGGQRLLVQGTTGLSTGVHNHQEIILPNGTFVAPSAWISARINAENAGTPAGAGSTPFDPEGFLMTLNDAEQRELLTLMRDVQNRVRGPQDRPYDMLQSIEGAALEARVRVRGPLDQPYDMLQAIYGAVTGRQPVEIDEAEFARALAPTIVALVESNQTAVITAIKQLPAQTVKAIKDAL